MSQIPELIKLERENKQMKLTYNNGDNYVVSYDDLRHSCPCANALHYAMKMKPPNPSADKLSHFLLKNRRLEQ